MEADIGTFQVLNEDVIEVILNQLSNRDILTLDKAFGDMKYNFGLMNKRLIKAKTEMGLMIASNYLSDVEVLFLDEAFPEIKNNYEQMQKRVRSAIDNVFGVLWGTETMDELYDEVRRFCSERHFMCRECKTCTKNAEERLYLYNTKNKYVCEHCKAQCYEPWQLRLHLDRREYGRFKMCPMGFPLLQRKEIWENIDVRTVDWKRISWLTKEEWENYWL